MPNQAGTLELLARGFARALQPLRERLAAPGGALALLDEMGLRLPPELAAAAEVADAVGDTLEHLAALPDRLAALTAAIDAEDVGAIAQAGQALLAAAQAVVADLPRIAAALREAADTEIRGRVAAFAETFARRLLDLLVIDYLQTELPRLAAALRVAGIIDIHHVAADPADPVGAPYQARVLRLDRIGTLLTDPAEHLRELYGWGEADFDGAALFRALAVFVESVELPVLVLDPPGEPGLLEAYLFQLRAQDAGQTPGEDPPGIEMRLRVPGAAAFAAEYPLGEDWTIRSAAAGSWTGDLLAAITPPLRLSARAEGGSAALEASLGVHTAGPGPTVLLGATGGTRLEAREIGASSLRAEDEGGRPEAGCVAELGRGGTARRTNSRK